MSEPNDDMTTPVQSIAASNLYRKMVEEIEDYAIILLDTQGVIRNWNKGAEKIKQYSEAEAIGKNFRMFYLPEDLEKGVPDMMLEQARTYGRTAREGWRLRKDGTKFWGSIVITALHDDKGDTVGFSKVTRDLTARKLAEDTLKRNSENLELLNEELRKSEERYHRMIAEIQDYAIILLNETGEITDAIRVEVEHASDEPITCMLPYCKTEKGFEQRIDPYLEPGDRTVFS